MTKMITPHPLPKWPPETTRPPGVTTTTPEGEGDEVSVTLYLSGGHIQTRLNTAVVLGICRWIRGEAPLNRLGIPIVINAADGRRRSTVRVSDIRAIDYLLE